MTKRNADLLWLWRLFCASTLIVALVTPLLEPVHAASATPRTGTQSLYAQEPPDPDDTQAPTLIGPQVRYPAWLLDLLRRPAPYTTTAGVAILQTADTGDNGLDAGHIYNGDRITYTIMLSNTSGVTLNNINVVDILPRDALADIVIAGSTSWEFNYETITYLDQIGIEETITATREISWSIASLAHGQTHTLTFSGNVVGQEDNTTFINRAFVLYYLEGSPDPGSASAAELPITAHMRIPIANLGGMTISSVATWLSRDMGGTLSHDWGDFDRDGDLDLVLGSALGTTIYRNDNGRLNLYWISPLNDQGKNRLSYGVRWADLNPDNDYLELVAVGDVVQGDATFIAELPGINYVYVMTDTAKKFITMDTFTSTHQLMRVEAGDFDGSGLIDLVASTNVINADCPVILFRNLGNGNFSNAPNSDETHYTECLSGSNTEGGGATAAIAAADFNNNGALDLAIGVFPATLRLLINSATGASPPITLSNPFTGTPHIDIETTLQYIPYDLAWGDFDGDGYLDLAAAYPLQRTVRVYRNLNGTTLQPLTSTIRTDAFFTPRALDWGDFNADGRLDLAVANEPPGIYQYNTQTAKFEKVATLDLPTIGGQVWSLRGAAVRDAGSLSLLVSNRDGPSQLYTTFGPKLRQTITGISTKNMSSVAWGDVDSDGDLDLLYGSGPARLSSQLHINKEGNFSTDRLFLSSGFGPHAVAFGDMTTNGTLDVAIGTLEKLQIYTNAQIDDSDNDIDQSPALTLLNGHRIHSLAWGDPNDDGKLDLLVGAETAAGRHVIHLFVNRDNLLQTTPALTMPVASKVQNLLWKDFDGDYYLDFAVGQQAGPTLIYKNNGDLTFSPYWNSGTAFDTRSLDAADYNNNGHFDLIEGNFGAYDVLWENRAATQPDNPFTQVFTFTTPHSQTTSVAWGDWDNDGYPDLAVGTYNAYDIVYANRQSAPGAPSFSEAWRSQEQANTTGIAWGDRDNDGDLDLAVSRTGGWSGIYENVISHPAHIFTTDTRRNYQLPNDAPYVYIERPGFTDDAYQFSSGNVVAGPTKPTVEIRYRLFDPEEHPIAHTIFEYSLDGGTQWRTATPADPNSIPITRTSINGFPGIFTWNAAADQAISDDARFRIRVIPLDRYGPVQRAANRGISPPFRVRATTCTWPADITIKAYLQPTGTLVAPAQVIQPKQEIRFEAHVNYVSGNIFEQAWTFGDGTSEKGLIWPTIEPITHVYASINVYTVIVRIDGEACPEARPGFASRLMYVGVTRPLDKFIYLPLVLKNYRGGVIAYSEPPTWAPDAETELPVVDAPSNEPAAASAPPTRSVNVQAAPQAASAVAMPPNTVRITDSPLGVDSQPAINNDGTRIAFWSTGRHGAANADGNIEIFLARDGTAYPLQLTDSKGTILGGFNLGPTINGAGNYVAFFSDQDLLGANNTGAQVVLSNTGQLLEQQNRDRNFEIFMAEIDGNQVSLLQLTNTTGGENILPSMSDSGRCIAFASSIDLTGDMKRGTGTGIFVAEITRTQGITWNVGYTRVVTPSGANDQPSISGDGRFVTFVSDQDLVPGNNAAPNDNREIFVAELENHQVKRYIQVTQTPEGVTNEQPSIVARKTPTDTVLNVVFLSDYDWPDNVDNANRDRHVALAVITLTTDANLPPIIDVYAVPQAPGEKDYPTISTDGGRIAYISTADQKLHLYDTFEERDIAENAPVQHAFPALSADGTRMAFVANWDIYRGEYPLVDLALVKSADTNEAETGDTVTYVFTATNTGPSPATDAKIVDILPEGMQAQITPLNPDNYRDAGASGFSTCTSGGCVHRGTGWNATAQALTIVDFSGRVFPLPDRNDTSPAAQWADMRNNELLLHMESVPPIDVNTGGVNRTISVEGTPTAIAGKIGNALVFNGTAALHAPNVLNTISTGATATWMTWVRRDSTSPGGLMAEIDAPWDGWVIDFPSGSQVRFRGSTQFYIFSIVSEKTVDITPPVGEWFHLAITWRDTFSPNDIRIYINGREVTGGGFLYATQDQFGAPANTLYIGRDHWGSYFRGALDEVAVFSRILAAEEILAIYERQTPAYTAYFDSALMQETTGSNAWSTLAWYPSLPVGVELPNNGANWTISDTQTLANSGYRYPTGTLAMSGTMLLLHMNEASGATSFFDTSGVRDAQGYRNEAYCDGGRCPQAATGRFNGGLYFDGSDDHIYVREPKDFASTEMTVMFWLRTQQSGGGLFQYSVTDSPSVDDGRWRFQENELTINQPGGLQVRLGGQSYNSSVAVNDGEWHHIAVTWNNAANTIVIYRDGVVAQTIASVTPYTLTQPHNDARFAARVVLGNRLGYTYEQAQECFWIGWSYYCFPTYVYSLKETSQNPYRGTLDEVAVFKRALNADEVRAAYLRGTARMLFQVRTCATSACNGSNDYFVGPGGLRHTYYTDEPDNRTPLWSLAGVESNQYLQYRTYMDGFIPYHTPELITVTVRPRAECGTNTAKSVITCTLSTRESPLPVYETVVVRVPVYVTSNAFASANIINGQLTIQNQARILAIEADHHQANNTDAWPLTLKPISITAVSISPASPAWEVNQTGYLTATVTPGNATPPVWYEWTAPLHGTQLYTVTTDWLNHTVAYSYTTAGTRTITVRARNTPNGVWQTDSVLVKVNHPRPHIDTLTPNETDAYSPTLTVTIDGSGFVNNTVTRVLWNGALLATSNVVSSTQMTAVIPAANFLLGGEYAITVRNAQAGLDTRISDPAIFTVYNRVPTMNSVVPVSTTINTNTPVVISGDYFATTGAIVRLYRPAAATVNLTPSAVTRTQVNVTVPAGNIQAAGYYSLTVQNPTPRRGDGESTPLLFTVYNPQPTITSFSPLTATAGNTFTLIINGTNFINGAQIFWNGQARNTTFVSSTRLQATITADVVTQGIVPVFVRNPAPSVADSNTIDFTVVP